MRGTSDHTRQSGAGAPWRDRLLPLVIVLVGLLIALTQLVEVVDRVRSDTAVRGTTVGESGCVTGARFTDPAGTAHVVDLRVYKANCVDGEPGESVTVYFDADDPDTFAATRSLWWPGLLTALGAVVVAVGVRGLVRGPAPAPARAPSRPPVVVSVPRRRRRPGPPEARKHFLLDDDEDASYRWDYALGRTEVLRDRVRAELALPAAERTSQAGDGLLAAIEQQLDAMLRCLRDSAVTGAEGHGRVASRLVVDEMSHTSRLGEDVLALVRRLFD